MEILRWVIFASILRLIACVLSFMCKVSVYQRQGKSLEYNAGASCSCLSSNGFRVSNAKRKCEACTCSLGDGSAPGALHGGESGAGGLAADPRLDLDDVEGAEARLLAARLVPPPDGHGKFPGVGLLLPVL